MCLTALPACAASIAGCSFPEKSWGRRIVFDANAGGIVGTRNHRSDDPRGEMSAHGWLLWISSVDSVVAAGTLILIMVLRRWAGVYFAIALGAAVVLILSLTILLRALGLA